MTQWQTLAKNYTRWQHVFPGEKRANKWFKFTFTGCNNAVRNLSWGSETHWCSARNAREPGRGGIGSALALSKTVARIAKERVAGHTLDACPRLGTGEGGANATGPGAACGQT